MANFFSRMLQGIFGNKYEKDVQGIKPLVAEINKHSGQMQTLDHDSLRAYTQRFKQSIADYLASIDEEIGGLQQTLHENPTMDPAEKDEYYKAIDKLRAERDTSLEQVLMQILPEAFAVVKETARRFTENQTLTVTATDLDRELAVQFPNIVIEGDNAHYHNTWIAAGNPVTWNMMHYDVQLIGGIVLHQGKISEMATGEGKTLVATLPAYLNGLAGQGVHIVTVNDYLAKRDSEWMGTIFQFLGLTVDCIDKHRPNSPERRKAYLADITYGTNNEFGFDYLRDNMVRTPAELVQRKHHYAMVDEVDSVLVDDARTPLIISGPADRGEEQEFEALKPRIERLVNAQQEYVRGQLNEAKRSIAEGKADEKSGGLALFRAHKGLPKNKPLIKFLSEPGMKAVLSATENYYLSEQQRRMPEAEKELFFVIDEKNNSVEMTDKGIALITGVSEDPNFFVLPDLGSNLAEIEQSALSPQEKVEAKDKLMQDFAIKSDRVHSIQQLLKAYTLFEKDVEYIVDDNKVLIVDESTGRVLDGRRYSDGLHQAIEAKEGVHIEAATQTYATVTLQNYFRMYHKLAGMTGTAETEAGELWEIYKLDVVVIPTNRPIIRDDREDLVYKTVREKYNAVTDEIERLINIGRPVLVGTTSVENSEILSRLLDRRKIKHNVLNAKHHAREAEIVAEAGVAGHVTIATNMAGRGTDIKLGPGVKEAGGLAIIGTERHESRRVDRQLRGRAGRQGDPGSSQFYVSLEDNLMRLFGSDRIASVMDRMGHQDGDVIQHSMISKSIERAQKKVEENNFGIRKRLLDYDQVMNEQRKIIYTKRRHALFGERLSLDLYNTFHDICSELVNTYIDLQDYENFKLEVIRFFASETNISQDEFSRHTKKRDILIDKLYHEVTEIYQRKMEVLVTPFIPVFEQVAQNPPMDYERLVIPSADNKYVVQFFVNQHNIIIPFFDGRRLIQAYVKLDNLVASNGKTAIKELEKSVSLAFIDEMWKEQLRRMDDLKQSVQAAVYEQKDPLLIYKKEAFNVFAEMVGELNRDITSFLFRTGVYIQQANPELVRSIDQQTPKHLQESRTEVGHADDHNTLGVDEAEVEHIIEEKGQLKMPVRNTAPRIGRNDPCPCGSGKKYKHCHGK